MLHPQSMIRMPQFDEVFFAALFMQFCVTCCMINGNTDKGVALCHLSVNFLAKPKPATGIHVRLQPTQQVKITKKNILRPIPSISK